MNEKKIRAAKIASAQKKAVSNHSGQWNYRIGGYYLLAEINEKSYLCKTIDIMDAKVLVFAYIFQLVEVLGLPIMFIKKKSRK